METNANRERVSPSLLSPVHSCPPLWPFLSGVPRDDRRSLTPSPSKPNSLSICICPCSFVFPVFSREGLKSRGKVSISLAFLIYENNVKANII